MGTLEVRQYQTVQGRVPVAEWLEGLRDPRARLRIVLWRDQRTQDSDIEKAHAYWKDYKARCG